MTKTQKAAILVLVVLSAVGLPHTWFISLAAFNSLNPHTLIFMVEFTVSNETADTVWVTPIGTVGSEGKRKPLPLTIWRVPAFPSFRDGKFKLKPSEEIQIFYDWDDINFSEIVVEGRGVPTRMLVTDPNPTRAQYHRPRQDLYAITESALVEATGEVMKAAELTGFRSDTYGKMLLGFIPLAAPLPVGLILLRVRRNRIKAPSN